MDTTTQFIVGFAVAAALWIGFQLIKRRGDRIRAEREATYQREKEEKMRMAAEEMASSSDPYADFKDKVARSKSH